MRIINKQISLEQVTSRLPGLVPAYEDGVLYLFDEASLKRRFNDKSNNYGMIPLNITLSKKPTEITCSVSGETEENDGMEIVTCDNPAFVMSWETLSKWYSFFSEYYRLLNDYGHCKVSYQSAVDYYNNESRGIFANQMKYGGNEEGYKELDKLFSERGGKVKKLKSCNDRAEDEGFFCWLRKYAVKTDITEGTPNFNALLSTQPDDCGANAKPCDLAIPRIDDHINLQVSIDDLGEFSIFSKEYSLGEDCGGEVVYDGEKTMVLKDNKLGYIFNPIAMEMQFNEDDWIDYTEKYIEDHPDYFSVDFDYYGFNEDGSKVTGETEEEVEEKLKTYFPVTRERGVLIESGIIPIYEAEFLNIEGKDYIVSREEGTETPYIYINGKKIYADLNTSDFKYHFVYKKNETFERCKKDAIENGDLKEYVLYKGYPYMVEDNQIQINDTVFFEVDGYFDDNGELIYFKDDEAFTLFTDVNFFYMNNTEKEDRLEYSRVTLEKTINEHGVERKRWLPDIDGDYFIKQDEELTVQSSNLITGITASKLSTLKTRNVLVDDTGKKIEGTYEVENKSYFQPGEGEVLGCVYKLGNTANIRPFSKTSGTTDSDELEDHNYFIGDIISEITFYYEDVDGVRHSESTDLLETVTSGMPEYAYFDNENVQCDVVYNIGATLVRYEGSGFTLADDDEKNEGVIYREHVEFVETFVEYKLKSNLKKVTPFEKKTVSASSLSYPVICYMLKQEDELVENGDYNYFDNLATFEMAIKRRKTVDGNGTTIDNNSANNDSCISPVFRMEYSIGSVLSEKTISDIYIDRGINYAIDKHLKLGEVTSFEALEQYNNGYFKMMEN